MPKFRICTLLCAVALICCTACAPSGKGAATPSRPSASAAAPSATDSVTSAEKSALTLDRFTALFNSVRGDAEEISRDGWSIIGSGGITEYRHMRDERAYLEPELLVVTGVDGIIERVTVTCSDESLSEQNLAAFHAYLTAVIRVMSPDESDPSALAYRLYDSAFSGSEYVLPDGTEVYTRDDNGSVKVTVTPYGKEL